MDKMNKMIVLTLVSGMMSLSPMILGAAGMQKTMDCSMMVPEMQQFAAQLTPANKMMFCGKISIKKL